MTGVDDPDAWLFLGGEVPAAGRDLGEVALGPYVLQRVAATDPALGGVVDPRWVLTEVLVLRRRAPAAPWERRAARELLPVLGDDVGAPARALQLAGEPVTLPSTHVSATRDIDAASWESWLDEVCDEHGRVIDPELREAMRAELDDPDGEDADAELAIVRTKLAAADLEQLVRSVRERLEVELPADYLAFLRDVGALRVRVLDEEPEPDLGAALARAGARAPLDAAETRRLEVAARMLENLPLVGPECELLAPSAVLRELDRSGVRSARENEGRTYVPFFRNANERFAFDMGAEPATVVTLPDADVMHGSFAAWLAAWRDASLVSAAIEPADDGGARLATRESLTRAWSEIARWVRPLYEKA